MNKIRVYNDDEIKILLKNPNINGIKNKSQIIYKNEFKLWAVKEKLSFKEKTAREIFVAGGFDMNILDERTPQRRLYSWLKKYKKFGEDYFTDKNIYSYKALDKELTPNNLNYYIKSSINDPKFIALIIKRDNNGNLHIRNFMKDKNEKINC